MDGSTQSILGKTRTDQTFNNGLNRLHFPFGAGAGYSAAMPFPTAPMLRIEHLCLRWPDGVHQFRDLSLAFGPGVTLLDGDSGKTTLLRTIAGELPADGRIALDGRTRDDDAAGWARDVAFLDATDERLDALTPDGVMAVVRRRHAALDEPAWRRHAEAFGLGPHLPKAMFQLSTGSRRKVGLAALLAARCPLTLLDDAAAGLDAASLRHLRAALAQANAEPARATIVVAGAGLDGLVCNSTVTLPAQECT